MTHATGKPSTAFTLTRAAAPMFVADVQRVFADVTRYPVEILEPDANIEEDLGIDSVKLGEILAVLRERHGLPMMADLRSQVESERWRTIAGVAGIVAQFSRVEGNGSGTAAPVAPATVSVAPAVVNAPAVSTSAVSPAMLLGEVQSTFSEITRYPVEILEPEANLEEDLGIDSVKLGEIFAALRERYALPAMSEIRERVTPERMRTIRGITGVIAELGTTVHASAPTPASAPAQPVAPIAASPAYTAVVQVPSTVTPRRVFEGKFALVTGSSHEVGKTIARHLSDLGATVVAANDTIDASYSQIESHFGGLDFYIHTSSNGALAPIDRITGPDWEKAFRANVGDLHAGALRATRLMQSRGGGRIITFSTTASDRCIAGAACQGTVNAAVEALTRYLAVELRSRGIRVNCIKTGPIDNDAVDQRSDVCGLVTALLSDELEFMTGSVIVLDGGRASPL